MNLTVAILTTHDLPRLRRAVQSVRQAGLPYWVEINTQDKSYRRRAASYCRRNEVPFMESESDGTAGTGKQAVFDRRDAMATSHVLLLDGDDFLYPCAGEVLTRTLSHLPADVLTFPCYDQIDEEGALACWDGTAPWVWDGLPGPGRARWLWDEPLVVGPGLTLVFSQKAMAMLRWEREKQLWEDTALLLESLALHQEAKLLSVMCMSTDVVVIDKSTPNSGQKQVDWSAVSANLRLLIARRGRPEMARSDVRELPFLWPSSAINQHEKADILLKARKESAS